MVHDTRGRPVAAELKPSFPAKRFGRTAMDPERRHWTSSREGLLWVTNCRAASPGKSALPPTADVMRNAANGRGGPDPVIADVSGRN
jgi:hypothetical protein